MTGTLILSNGYAAGNRILPPRVTGAVGGGLFATDIGGSVIVTAGSAYTLDSAQGFPQGGTITLINILGAPITITPAGSMSTQIPGAVPSSGSVRTLANLHLVTIFFINSTTAYIVGDGITSS